MHTRRKFMGQMLGGATALAARRGWASARILGANGRVRFGLIGAGGRGTEILEVALKCANVECLYAPTRQGARLGSGGEDRFRFSSPPRRQIH